MRALPQAILFPTLICWLIHSSASSTYPTYTITGLSQVSAAFQDVIAVYGNFTHASQSTVSCQFTVQPVNSSFSDSGSQKMYITTPQLVSSSQVTCVVSFTSTDNSFVYLNIIPIGSINQTIGTNYFLYVDNSIMAVDEIFSSLSNVDCDTSFPSSIGCPKILSASNGLTMGSSFPSSSFVNRTVVHSTKSSTALSPQAPENYAEFLFYSSSSGNGQWIEVWMYGGIYSLMSSLENNNSSSYINLVLTSDTSYTVVKQPCSFTNNTYYRLLVRAIQPTFGNAWVIRGDLILVPSLSIICTVSKIIDNFDYQTFFSPKYTVAISMSNAIYTTSNVNLTQTSLESIILAAGSGSIATYNVYVDRMVMECQLGFCSVSSLNNAPSLGNQAQSVQNVNTTPIIVVIVVLIIVSVIGGLFVLTVHCIRRRRKIKPELLRDHVEEFTQ